MEWKDAIPLIVAGVALIGVITSPWIAFLVNRRIENHKSDLAQEQAEHSVRYKAQFERRSNFVHDFYKKLRATKDELRCLLSPNGPADKNEQFHKYQHVVREATLFLEDHRFLITEELYTLIDTLLTRYTDIAYTFVGDLHDQNSGDPRVSDPPKNHWSKAIEALKEQEVPLAEIRRAFSQVVDPK